MSRFTNQAAADLAVEARVALRCILSIADELGRGRWPARSVPLDPRTAGDEDRLRAVTVALLDAIDSLAGAGCLSDDWAIPDELARQVVPVLQCVQGLVSTLGERTELQLGDVARDAAGWSQVLELCTAISSAAEVGLAMWREPTMAVAS